MTHSEPAHDHMHLPVNSALIFQVSDNFMEVLKFYFYSLMFTTSKEIFLKNKALKKENIVETESDLPVAMDKHFDSAWEEEFTRLRESFSSIFIEAQKQATSKDGVCCAYLKDHFSVRMVSMFETVFLDKIEQCKILFDLDIVKLKCNDTLYTNLPKRIGASIQSQSHLKDNLYLVYLDTHFTGKSTIQAGDVSDNSKFNDLMIIRSNLMESLLSTDSKFSSTHGGVYNPCIQH